MTLRWLIAHFENRISELGTSLMMLLLAFHLTLWPDAISASAFRLILEVLPLPWLKWGFLAAGTLRLASLVANGKWPYWGPVLRAIGALSGGVIWAQMSVALYRFTPISGTPQLGISIYLVLSVMELLSMYRALVMANRARFQSVSRHVKAV
jgi:hypothetical protein